MTKTERITLYDAAQEFMGLIHAEAGRLLDERADDAEVIVTISGYSVKMELRTLKRMDRVYMHAHEAKCAKSERKHKAGLFGGVM